MFPPWAGDTRPGPHLKATPMGLINTLERPGEFDALANLRPDEPYFLLIGRDRSAPPLIYEWADKRRRKTLAEFDAGTITLEQRDMELRKCTEAESIASDMISYKNQWETEASEPSAPTSYTGHQLPAETLMRDKLQSTTARAVSALHNAIGEVTALAQLMNEATLAGHGEHDPHEAQVIVGKMRDAAERLTPKLPVR